VKVINVQEAKAQLSRLLEEAAGGEVIVLGKQGKPIAKLTAYAPEREPRRLGGLEGKIQLADDFDEEDPRVRDMFEGAME